MNGNRGLWAAAAGAAVVGAVLLLPGRPARTHPDAQVPPGRQPAATQSVGPVAQSTPPSAVGPASPSPSISPAGEPGRPAAEAQWRPVATGFARDFANPGSGQADWLARVRRWTTTYLADQYRQTDPHRIPAATLIDVKPIATGETIVSFVATYDTGLRIDCRVELGPTGWKVTTAAPAARTAQR